MINYAEKISFQLNYNYWNNLSIRLSWIRYTVLQATGSYTFGPISSTRKWLMTT